MLKRFLRLISICCALDGDVLDKSESESEIDLLPSVFAHTMNVLVLGASSTESRK